MLKFLKKNAKKILLRRKIKQKDFFDKLSESVRYELAIQRYSEYAFSSFRNEKQELSCNSNGIIVSLTTFGKRINNVHLTIESIFRQTIRPEKIILWLAESEFTEETLIVEVATKARS